MNDHTPSIAEVRDAYVRGMRMFFLASPSEHEQEFDRFIEYLARVQNAALTRAEIFAGERDAAFAELDSLHSTLAKVREAIEDTTQVWDGDDGTDAHVVTADARDLLMILDVAPTTEGDTDEG